MLVSPATGTRVRASVSCLEVSDFLEMEGPPEANLVFCLRVTSLFLKLRSSGAALFVSCARPCFAGGA